MNDQYANELYLLDDSDKTLYSIIFVAKYSDEKSNGGGDDGDQKGVSHRIRDQLNRIEKNLKSELRLVHKKLEPQKRGGHVMNNEND